MQTPIRIIEKSRPMRYIPLTEEEKGKILKEIGVSSFEELICAIPEEIRVKNDLNLPQAVCEEELLEKVYNIAKKNANFFEMKPLVGAGAYRHYVPEVVKSVMARSEFYTAYTPYQPEVSQGTLQTMFEVQTHLSRLTGMDVVVPSLYDGASATAEAVLMAMRLTHKNKIMLGALLHPHYKETIKTYTAPHDVEIMEIPFENYLTDINELERNLDDNVACVIIQNPNFLGGIERMKAISDVVHKKQALMIETVTESLSLAILTSGRENGIDMFTGEAQSFGMELNFGGPYNGFLATKNEFIRQLPGRIAGETVDIEGKRAFVMTLRAREQDIKREKATSNICTNHALNLFAIDAYLSLMGKEGLYELALLNAKSAHYLREGLISTGRFNGFAYPFFNEFVMKAKDSVEKVSEKLLQNSLIPPLRLSELFPSMENALLFAVTEIFSREDLDRIIDIFKEGV